MDGQVAESSEKKLKAKSKEQAVGNQDLREHCKFLEEEIENKNRELRESQVRQVEEESRDIPIVDGYYPRRIFC